VSLGPGRRTALRGSLRQVEHGQPADHVGRQFLDLLAVAESGDFSRAAEARGVTPQPLHALPGTERAPVACLVYSPESGMGRIVATVRAMSPLKPTLKPAFSSHVAKLLVTMALDGRGMAWLPRSLIEEHLAAGEPVGPATRRGTSRSRSTSSRRRLVQRRWPSNSGGTSWAQPRGDSLARLAAALEASAARFGGD
jgi:DNA-binding transcriptional LysR family regulator